MSAPAALPLLTPRWKALRPHPTQIALWNTQARFVVVPAGRRSGKTEIAKRRIVYKALAETRYADAWFVCAAPTLPQARRIYWRDLKALIPREFLASRPRESDLTITLINGAEITVVGMDQPARIEGRSLDGIVLDEYANMQARVWGENVRPALSDRGGWAWLIGVPEGRNHYYQQAERARNDPSGIWALYHWVSADILPAEEIRQAKLDLDELTYRQEYEADFLNFSGRAYYTFERQIHARERLLYDPKLPLIFCFDFNAAPGVAVVCQEQYYKGIHAISSYGSQSVAIPTNTQITMAIDEVWIAQNSTTELVCRKLLEKYGNHKGEVLCYGDATGGNKGSAKVRGSDWDIVKEALKPAYRTNLKFRVPSSNPKERSRVNAVNSRFRSVVGFVKALVDPINCPHLIEDLEGVALDIDGSGQIDKPKGTHLTHISDGFGYYIENKFPIGGQHLVTQEAY